MVEKKKNKRNLGKYTDDELKAMQGVVLETKEVAPRKWKQSDISECCGGGNSHLSGVVGRKTAKTEHNEVVMFNVQVLCDTFTSDRLKAEKDRTLPTGTNWEEARDILLPKFRVLKKKKKVADDDGNKVFFPTLNKLLEAQERGNNLLEDILSEAVILNSLMRGQHVGAPPPMEPMPPMPPPPPQPPLGPPPEATMPQQSVIPGTSMSLVKG